MGININTLKHKLSNRYSTTYTYSTNSTNENALAVVLDVMHDYGYFIGEYPTILDISVGNGRKSKENPHQIRHWSTVLVNGISILDFVGLEDAIEFPMANGTRTITDRMTAAAEKRGAYTTFEIDNYMTTRKTLEILGIPLADNKIISYDFGWAYSKTKTEDYLKPLDQMGSASNTLHCPLSGNPYNQVTGVRKNLTRNAYRSMVVKNINYTFSICFMDAPFIYLRVFDVFNERLKREVDYDCLKISTSSINTHEQYRNLKLDLRQEENIELVKILFGMKTPTRKQQARIKHIKKYLNGVNILPACEDGREDATTSKYWYMVRRSKYLAKKKWCSKPKFKKSR